MRNLLDVLGGQLPATPPAIRSVSANCSAAADARVLDGNVSSAALLGFARCHARVGDHIDLDSPAARAFPRWRQLCPRACCPGRAATRLSTICALATSLGELPLLFGNVGGNLSSNRSLAAQLLDAGPSRMVLRRPPTLHGTCVGRRSSASDVRGDTLILVYTMTRVRTSWVKTRLPSGTGVLIETSQR